jgi:hypothetical protein
MKRKLGLFLLASLGLLVGCGDDAETNDATGPGSGSGGGSSTGTGPTTGSGGSSPTSLPAAVTEDTTVSGDVDMPVSATVAAGVTLTVTPGATLHSSAAAALVVQGTLIALGTAESPIVFQSKDHAGADGWVGIELEAGGAATLSYVDVHDATLALSAKAGSGFGIDHLNIDTSSNLLMLASDGAIDHGVLHGRGANQADDPIQINAASPQLTNLLLDEANPYTDFVQLNGGSPLFDHLEVTSAHCAFHFNSGMAATISNSNVHDNLYGLMVEASEGTQVVSSNFVNNDNNIGTCTTGDVTATSVYFDDAAFDGSCNTQSNQSPSGQPLTDVGPQP